MIKLGLTHKAALACGSMVLYVFVCYFSPRRVKNNIQKKICGMRKSYKYEVILYWSADDDAFIAEVPELPGCAADGSSYQEALQNAEIIIQEWIETAQALNRPIPEPKGRLLFA